MISLSKEATNEIKGSISSRVGIRNQREDWDMPDTKTEKKDLSEWLTGKWSDLALLNALEKQLLISSHRALQSTGYFVIISHVLAFHLLKKDIITTHFTGML